MNKELASKTLRTVATKHMPKNARQFTWLYTGDKKRSNILGGRAFSKPVKGKVIHIDDQFMILKTQRTHFLVTLKSLLDIEPAVGDNVLYTEYTPRRMDGSYLYDFEQIPGSTTIILTVSSLSNWNLPKPDNPFLQQLVDQLVNMEAEDGIKAAKRNLDYYCQYFDEKTANKVKEVYCLGQGFRDLAGRKYDFM